MYKKIVFCFLFLACDSPTTAPSGPDTLANMDAGLSEYLVCHNPTSPEHGKKCSEKCLDSEKETSAYCWPITRADCELDLGMAWQEENCHFFE